MTTATADEAHSDSTRRGGRWLILLGVLALALGVVGLFMTFALTVLSTIWFGVLLALLGGAHVVFAFREKARRWLNLLLGAVYLLAGVVIVLNPVGAAVSLTLLIGVILGALGIARIVWSFWFPGFERKLLGVLGGVISVALGWMILANWPWSGLWVLGLFIAVDMIIYGLTMIGVGSALRRVSRSTTRG